MPARPRHLRHFFAVLMLLLLPLQAAWALAAAYCQHETAPNAQHFGHHEHQHGAAGSCAPKAVGSVDSDCGFCHAAFVMALPITDLTLAAAPDDLPAPQPPPAATPAPHDPPERPDWRS